MFDGIISGFTAQQAHFPWDNEIPWLLALAYIWPRYIAAENGDLRRQNNNAYGIRARYCSSEYGEEVGYLRAASATG